MRKLFVYHGFGAALSECELSTEVQEWLEKDDMESVICYLIDTDQCNYVPVMEFENEHKGDFNEYGEVDGWVYIDNTMSDIPEKKHCYYAYIEHMRVLIIE